jgi:glucan phosphoethanolaminetransferase (alkaline phosphatase superfamily)
MLVDLTSLFLLEIIILIITTIIIKFLHFFHPNPKSTVAIITFPLIFLLIIIFHLKKLIINFHLLIIIKIILKIIIIISPNPPYPTPITQPIILITQTPTYLIITIIPMPIINPILIYLL